MMDGDFVLKAAAGVLAQFEDGCKLQQCRLSELLIKQNEMLNATQKELAKQKEMLNATNQELANLNAMDCMQFEDMIIILKTCQLRLFAIKERMRKASTKSAKLKARSLKIQQIKQKVALERELRREAQLTREQEMVARAPNFQEKRS